MAFLNIGQSRESPPGCQQRNVNLDQDFARALLPGGWDIINISPLDAYPSTTVPALFAPEPGEMPLRSCLSTGEDFLVSHRKLTPELNKALTAASRRGVDVAVVTCTTDFELQLPKEEEGESSEASSRRLELVLPGMVLAAAAAARDWQDVYKVAVVCPVDEQLGPLADRWRARLPGGIEVKAVRMAPGAKLESWDELGSRLWNGESIGVAILDCFGYSVQQGRRLESAGLRVLSVKQLTIEAVTRLGW